MIPLVRGLINSMRTCIAHRTRRSRQRRLHRVRPEVMSSQLRIAARETRDHDRRHPLPSSPCHQGSVDDRLHLAGAGSSWTSVDRTEFSSFSSCCRSLSMRCRSRRSFRCRFHSRKPAIAPMVATLFRKLWLSSSSCRMCCGGGVITLSSSLYESESALACGCGLRGPLEGVAVGRHWLHASQIHPLSPSRVIRRHWHLPGFDA